MIVLNELSTVEEYAKMCGVTKRTVYYRHYKGNIVSIEIDGHVFIDSKASPPAKHLNYVKKPLPKIELGEGIDPKYLVSVFLYTYNKKIRPDKYYALAMSGKIKSVVAGEMVFILRHEADQVAIIRRKKR